MSGMFRDDIGGIAARLDSFSCGGGVGQGGAVPNDQ